jgi:hypothetical protein
VKQYGCKQRSEQRTHHVKTRRLIMNLTIGRNIPARLIGLIILAGMLLVSGCARYARNADILYEPSTTVQGSNGDIYIVIPENQQTPSTKVRHVLGTVFDGDNRKIDDILSSRSPAEIFQAALGLELTKAGYSVIPVTKRPAAEQRVLDLTKTELSLDQNSEFTNTKVTAHVLAGMDVYKAGKMIKRLQYEATASKTDIKDRDLLAGKVLQEVLQSVMLQAAPEIRQLFTN